MLPLKDVIEILTQEKRKVELKLVKAYDSFCLYPNEADQNDWDRFSALDAAFDMAIEAIEKQIPMKIHIESDHPVYGYTLFCPRCNRMDIGGWSYCPNCGQSLTIETENDL